MTDITVFLDRLAEGDEHAATRLLDRVYAELRMLATAKLAREAPGHTLQPTALVHEAYMKVIGDADPGWDGRGHFFGAAGQAMRQIIVDQARRKGRVKHGGDRGRVVEQGTYDELLEAGGAFSRLHRAQFGVAS